jgi:hypothetical protein
LVEVKGNVRKLSLMSRTISRSAVVVNW